MTREQDERIDTLIRRLRTVEELLGRRGFHAGSLGVPLLALRARDAAVALGVSRRTLYAWTAGAKIPHVRQDGVVLYPVAELREWLSRRTASSSVRIDRTTESDLSAVDTPTDPALRS